MSANKECTEQNCEDLATVQVERWDMDEIVGYAIAHLTAFYVRNPDVFIDDLKQHREDKSEDSMSR